MPQIADAAQVTTIDVLAVALGRSPNWSAWTAVPGEVIGTWRGETVGVALDLIAALPEAEPMRCFLPGYGIRLRDDTSVLAEVAFCFRCRNAVVLRTAPGWFTFDPDSAPAQQLRHMFRQCAA